MQDKLIVVWSSILSNQKIGSHYPVSDIIYLHVSQLSLNVVDASHQTLKLNTGITIITK